MGVVADYWFFIRSSELVSKFFLGEKITFFFISNNVILYCLQHNVHIFSNLLFRKAKEVQTHFFEHLLPLFVFDLLFCFEMIRTINFYYYIQRLAIKIHNVAIQWFLTVEGVVHHAACTKLL